MQLSVTDVTEMSGGTFCLAGWCAAKNRMVRPLPDGRNWDGERIRSKNIIPGCILNFEEAGASSSGNYPHRTEDLIINSASIKRVGYNTPNWIWKDGPSTSSSLSDAFSGNVKTTSVWKGAKSGTHIEEGTQCSSLSAIELQRSQLRFFEGDFNGKKSLRAFMTDPYATYDLPVVAHNLKELYRIKGVESVSQSMPVKGPLHVRVGLARAWVKQPEKCAVMINGVFW